MENPAKELPSEIRELQTQIEQWRETREKRTAMPESLWSAAAELAKTHGIYPICQALRVSYESLKKRVKGPGDTHKNRQSRVSGFVEVSSMSIIGSGPSGSAEVEVVSRRGARMIVRFGDSAGLNMDTLLSVFWKQHR